MIKCPALLSALLVFVCVLAPGRASAGAEKDPKKSEDAFKARLIAIPFIYYSPETKLAFGAGGILNFRAGRDKERTRASSIWAFGNYSLA